MSPIAFTSEHVCRLHASREIQARANDFFDVASTVLALIVPFGSRIVASGKLRRGGGTAAAKAIKSVLNASDRVTDVTSFKVSEKFTEDSHLITFVAGGKIEDDELFFCACHVAIDRRHIIVEIRFPDIRVHKHALVRYQERMHQPLDKMFSVIGDTMRYAMNIAFFLPVGARLACPIEGGLLLGTVKHREDNAALNFRVDADGFHEPFFNEKPGLGWSGKVIDFRTFIDADSLNPAKTALRDRLDTYVAEIKPVVNMPLGTKPCFEAADPTLRLINGPEWQKVFSSKE